MNGSGAAAAAAATATATAAYETGASSCVDAASKTMAAVARAGKAGKCPPLLWIHNEASALLQLLKQRRVEGHMPKKLAKSEELVKVQRRLISALDRSKTSNSAEDAEMASLYEVSRVQLTAEIATMDREHAAQRRADGLQCIQKLLRICCGEKPKIEQRKVNLPPGVDRGAVVQALISIAEIAVRAEVRASVDGGGQLLIAKERVDAMGPYGRHVIEEATDLALAGTISFPWKRFYLAPLATRMMDDLKQYKPTFDHKPYRLKGKPRSGDFLPVALSTGHMSDGGAGALTPIKDAYVVATIDAENSEYTKFDILGDNFTETPRMAARRKDEELSPIEKWKTRPFLQKLFTEALTVAAGGKQRSPYLPSTAPACSGLDSYGLREAMFTAKLTKECTQFKPSLALTVLQLLQARRVLDFSAGWGDRLLGAIAHDGLERYLAFDPNPALQEGHNAMINTLVPEADRGRYKVLCSPAQTAEIPEGSTFDLLFTSPPFFNFEIYTHAKGQSVQEYTGFEAWLVKFLFGMLSRFWGYIESNGHVAIHMSDDWEYKICEPMCLFAESRLPLCRYCGVIASKGLRGTPRPIWVFQKMAEPSTTIAARATQASHHLEAHFPEVADLVARDWPL